MSRETTIGLCGVLGIWLTAGFALPLVNVLTVFTPTQLMVFRGFITAILAWVVLRGRIGNVDKHTYYIAIVLPLATLGLFQGIRYWGAGLTIVVLGATPLVNFIISAMSNRQISSASIVGMILVSGGVAIACVQGNFSWLGFCWSVFGMIMNGLLYECFARARASSLQKCFYACLGMGALGLLCSSPSSWSVSWTPDLILVLFGFAFVGGFLYWIANMLAFEHLPVGEASVLAQGETPAVIIGAFVLLDERLTSIQWIGVGVSLLGAAYLSQWLLQQTKDELTAVDAAE